MASTRGGAFTARLLVDIPLFPTLPSPVCTAVFVRGGLWLRDPAVRALVPFRRG